MAPVPHGRDVRAELGIPQAGLRAKRTSNSLCLRKGNFWGWQTGAVRGNCQRARGTVGWSTLDSLLSLNRVFWRGWNTGGHFHQDQRLPSCSRPGHDAEAWGAEVARAKVAVPETQNVVVRNFLTSLYVRQFLTLRTVRSVEDAGVRMALRPWPTPHCTKPKTTPSTNRKRTVSKPVASLKLRGL